MRESGETDIVDILEQVVLPVLRRMTRSGEVQAVSVLNKQVDERSEELWLEATLRGEMFRTVLWATGYPLASHADVRKRLASDLQDYVAESRFGWGELRSYEE